MNKMFNELSKEVCKFTKNPNIRWVLVLLLIMYVFSLDQFITREGDALLNSRLAKIIVIGLVILLAERDPFMAVLLAVSYLVSLHSMPYLEGMETKSKEEKEKDKDKDSKKSEHSEHSEKSDHSEHSEKSEHSEHSKDKK